MSDRRLIKENLRELDPEMSFTMKFACAMKWDEMQETDDPRCKHCERCDLHVFDLVGLNPTEISELVRKNGGEICGQAHVRNDNTLNFDPCRFPRRALQGKIKPMFPDG